SIILYAIFSLFYFLVLHYRIDAKLIYQSQQPVFFFDRTFYREFLSYPGGALELLSRFLSQFLFHSWTGALLLTILFCLVTFFTTLLLQSFGPKRAISLLAWIPSHLLFLLHHSYECPLAVSLGFLGAVGAALIFIRLAPKQFVLRLLTFACLYALVYYVTAGPALLYTAIVIFFEMLFHRHYLLSVLCAAVAGITPWLASSYLFILLLKKSYLMHLWLEGGGLQRYLLLALLLFSPIAIVFRALSSQMGEKAGIRFLQKFIAAERSTALWIVQTAVLLLIVALLSWSCVQKREKSLLALDYHARHGQWQKVIDTVQKNGLFDTYIGQMQLNRALYHENKLCDDMYAYPQRKLAGLFLHESVRHLYPLQYSDLFFELGLMNEAQHWAHEALSVTGDTPWNVQRLALVYVIKDDAAMAQKYLGMLKKTVWMRNWAEQMQNSLAKGDFSPFPQVSHLKSLMPTTDFIMIPAQPEACLEELLEANLSNKMAFEYYMAGLLLDGKVGRFINRLDGITAMNYAKMPRHFEEAVLMYAMNTGRRDFLPAGIGISRQTVSSFQDYLNIVKKYDDPASASRELEAAFGDTYWFYASYVYKKDQ
ncbi:hypothetical protein JW998_08135, partial [candidate division KSB1 bacterium]|nr:hypothetical protein [candidate division KSB1 bacterium]